MRFLGEDTPLKELLPKEFATAALALKPKVDGSRVMMQLSQPDAVRAVAVLANTIADRTGMPLRSSQRDNLAQIVTAMHNYLDAMGTFPANAIYSKAGKPLLSWRVALLPYLGQSKLYEQFKLDEPWDSPHNKALIAKMPKVYHSPKIKDARPGLTTYLAPINKAFIFTGTKDGVQIKDILDGTVNTAAIVDVSDEAGVIWTKPADLVVDEKEPWKGLLGHYPGFVLFGMADGSVKRVPRTAKASTIWALFTRAGGEVPPDLDR